MKLSRRQNIILAIFSVLFLGIVIYFLFETVIVLPQNMADNAEQFSSTIKESQEKGLFLGYYSPVQDSIRLGDLKIKTEKGWCEKSWRTEHSLFKKETAIKPDTGVNIVIPFESAVYFKNKIDVNVLTFPGVYESCAFWYDSRLGFINRISSDPDTLRIVYATDWGTGKKDTVQYIMQ